MSQFQPFTQAELDADPRLARLVQDREWLLTQLRQVVDHCRPSGARDEVMQLLRKQKQRQRDREAAHYAALQAENVRRSWKPSTFRDILGEPQYDTHIPERDGD